METNIIQTLEYKLELMKIPTYLDTKCEKEILKLYKNDDISLRKMADSLYDHMQRFMEDKQNMLSSREIFEPVNVQKKFKKKLGENVQMFSYRYMHNGDNRNLRLLFFLDKDYNYVFFSAFIEHDKKEYNKNIEKSIERLIK